MTEHIAGSEHSNPETAEVINDLLRTLRRKKGFGLFFVQCSPAQGEKVTKAIQEYFPQKRIENIELNRQSETLYEQLLEAYQKKGVEIALITGVEQALLSYEDTQRLAGWSSEEIYNYSWKGVPPVLSHLNRQREVFEENLPMALVFLVPSFVIDYFIQRAPDFFDWRSGFFKLVETLDNLEIFSQENLLDRELLSNLFLEQGLSSVSHFNYKQALHFYNRAIQLRPEHCQVWNARGVTLAKLQRYEEALESYNRAIELQPDFYQVWSNRGNLLSRLQRYEEALDNYERAIKLQPEYHRAWYNRGITLSTLQRYEESFESYSQAIKLQPKYDSAWINRGYCLLKMGRNTEAFDNLQRALDINGDKAKFLYHQACFLAILGEKEKSLNALAQSIELDPTKKSLAKLELDFEAFRDDPKYNLILQ